MICEEPILIGNIFQVLILVELTMGKSSGKKKKHTGEKTVDVNAKPKKSGEQNLKAVDEDMAVFINMSQDLKEEGNKLFQKRDYNGSMLKYEKAIKLLPKNHIDVAYLRSNMAACYMQKGPDAYHKAVDECNLALDVSPKYSKALLKRARCYEAMNRLDYALDDVRLVLRLEPNNLMAVEIAERVRKVLEKERIEADYKGTLLTPECKEPSRCAVEKEKSRKKKKKSGKTEDKVVVEEQNKTTDDKEHNVTHDKAVVEELHKVKEEDMRNIKLIFGEDIRWAQIPVNCSVLQLKKIVQIRFPSLQAALIKYKDHEGDLVTITTTEELRWAEASADMQGTIRLFILEVEPEQDPLFVHESENVTWAHKLEANQNGRPCSIDDWIIEFAQLFKNHVGFDSNSYLELHEIGMKLYSEAMEETVTSEEAQYIFDIAAEKFQEMAALALFNWGNVHMSRAKKKAPLIEDTSTESVLAQVNRAYEWALREYEKAGKKYREAVSIKPNFYEGFLALGQQQFEQAKQTWYFTVGSKVDLDKWSSLKVIDLFEHAQKNIEKGTEIWEEMEAQRLTELSNPDKKKKTLEEMGLDGILKELTADEATELATKMRSQINVLWGTMLYERSIIEFKLNNDIWEDYLEAAIDRFELAGASQIDTAVMIKNHCSNATAQEGLGFKIDEIVEAWNEMYDARRSQSDIQSFRLEPLLRRRGSKLHHILENV